MSANSLIYYPQENRRNIPIEESFTIEEQHNARQSLGIDYIQDNLIFPIGLKNKTLHIGHEDRLSLHEIESMLRKIKKLTRFDAIEMHPMPTEKIAESIRLIKIDNEDKSDPQVIFDEALAHASVTNANDLILQPRRDGALLICDYDGDREVIRTIDDLPTALQIQNFLNNRFPQRLPHQTSVIGYSSKHDGIRLRGRLRVFPTTDILAEESEQRRDHYVTRIIRPTRGLTRLEDLGMDDNQRERLYALIKDPRSSLLICGKPDSGKTITAYAILTWLAQDEAISHRLYTIEAPIEAKIENVQHQDIAPLLTGDASDNKELHRIVAGILQIKPYYMFVGEILNDILMDIAFRLWFARIPTLTTFHALTASDALMRLTTYRHPEEVNQSITGVTAQKLIKLLCSECYDFHPPKTETRRRFLMLSLTPPDLVPIRRENAACSICNGKGVLNGRSAIFEIVAITPRIRKALLTKDATQVAQAMYNRHTLPLMGRGCEMLVKNKIDEEEFLSIPIPEIEDRISLKKDGEA